MLYRAANGSRNRRLAYRMSKSSLSAVISRARALVRLVRSMCGVLAWTALAAACGSETRGQVLGRAPEPGEVDAAEPPPVIDAACSSCSGGITLSGLSMTAQHGGDGGSAFTDVCPGNQ